MYEINSEWKHCHNIDIERMFLVDERRIRSGLGWHRVIMISEHRAPFTDELCRIDMRVEDFLPLREKKIKKIWRHSIE